MARRRYFCKSVRSDCLEIDSEPNSEGHYRIVIEGTGSVYLTALAMLNLREFLAVGSDAHFPEWEDMED